MIFDELQEHLDKALENYSSGSFFDELKSAKEQFFHLTGKVDEDKDEFETRMNSFNSWYIFQYRRADGSRVIEEYIRNQELPPEFSSAFLNVNYSLFEFVKTSFSKQVVLKDILHNHKINLIKGHPPLSLVESDIFVGRVLSHQSQQYLLKGVCLLPHLVKSILSKQSKKIRKINNTEEEQKFLLDLEAMNTKASHYSHIDPSKIFVFK